MKKSLSLTLIALLAISFTFAAWASGPAASPTPAVGRACGQLAPQPAGKQPFQEVKDPAAPTGGPASSPRTTGGPDAYGYLFIDSLEPGGPAYGWVDISGTGTALGTGDDSAYTANLSAPFNFYGTDYSSLRMATNGYLSTDPTDNGPDLSNDCVPFPVAPSTGGGGRFYVLHDDLNVSATYSGNMYTQYFASCPRPSDALAGEPCTVCQWHNTIHFGGSVPFDFEAILYHTSGDIVYQFGPGNPETGSGSTTGIMDPTYTIGLKYACDTAGSIPDNLAVRFYTYLGPVGLSAVPTAQTACLGTAADYTFTVSNNTGAAATFDITAAGNAWTTTFPATVGPVADGSSANFTVTVVVDPLAAPGATDTVTVTATAGADSASAAVTTTATDVGPDSGAVLDPSFEDGSPNAFWTEASTNFGTPLCTVAGCGTGTGTGPRTGLWWAWFGGVAAYEEGSVTQMVTIPVGGNTLRFFTEAIVCAAPADFLEATIDGTQVFLMTGGDATCGTLGYTERTVDISAFADGNPHTLAFHSISYGSGNTNFFVDDVSIIEDCPSACVLTLAPATLPNGAVGAAYSQAITAAGGTAPYTYSVSAGSAPDGLVLDPNTGVLSGTPTTGGTFTFTVSAADSTFCLGSLVYTVIICPIITVDPATLPGGNLGLPYSATVTASGGTAPYTYAVTAGSLPAGVALDPNTGAISGTPTAGGTFSVTITATDANGCTGSTTYTVVFATYDVNIFDEYGRAFVCINTASGAWSWTVLRGIGAGMTFTGTGTLSNYNGTVSITTPYGQPVGVSIKYLARYFKGSGSFYHRPMRINSSAYDNNTTNNPMLCP